MKSKFSLLSILAALIIGLTVVFIGCTKEDVNAVVNYYGKVNYINTSTPFPDLEVKVTDGDNTHCLTHTDAEGKFSLSVKVEEINGNYYILVGDSTCVTKKVNLPGFGQPEIDLGTIEIEGPKVPVVTTAKVNSVTAESAVCGGTVTDDGRLTVTARGVCWSKTEYPTTQDAHTTNGSGKGEFTSELKDLEFGMKYYVRAYATNRMGTSYGEQISFTTTTGLPTVSTDSVCNILSTSATCGGTVGDNSGYQITARGICWSDKTATPTQDNDHTSEVAATGHFTSIMINLSRNTTYYVRAYATNEKGTNYGETKMFTTLNGLPTVITGEVTNVSASTATCKGNVTENGGYPITARGFCWSNTSSAPTVEDKHTTEVADKGEFSSILTGLEPNKTYYVRAYATNEVGTSYGEQLSFTTPSGLPVVETKDVLEIKAVSAQCGGVVLSDGGYKISECGTCWSTSSATPTIDDAHTLDILKDSTFTSKLLNLKINTTYYVRAYATNEYGTTYGKSVTFTTADGLPIVKTRNIGEEITESTIPIGGEIIDDGGFAILSCGVTWSTSPLPNITNHEFTTDDNASVVYSSLIKGVDVLATTYYIRAYATNENGTSYGEEVVCTPQHYEYFKLPFYMSGNRKYRIYNKTKGSMTYDAAMRYAKNFSFAGYSDWFVPAEAFFIPQQSTWSYGCVWCCESRAVSYYYYHKHYCGGSKAIEEADHGGLIYGVILAREEK